MRIPNTWWMRFIASWLVLVLLAPCVVASPSPAQPKDESQPQEGAAAASQGVSEESKAAVSKPEAIGSATFPDSPGTIRLQAAPDSQVVARAQQADLQEPVGTAAAPPVKTTGVAASRPAGAAIAPGKQRRARSLLIKVGALVGAGVAIGTVVALSSGSPSHPPGTH